MKTIRKNPYNMNYKAIISIQLILLLFSSLSAQDESEARSFIKTVNVDKESTLDLNNKYGNIYITTWDKDTALIRAEVTAFAPSQSKLKKMFDGVTINMTDTKYMIRVQTEFTQNINMLFESFKGMTSKLISYDSRVEINYYINIPEYINLKIDNRYGDLSMENITGSCSISVTNGSFKANSLGKGSSLTLTFCDATINSVSSCKFNSSFSEIELEKAGIISVNSISSKYNIKNVVEIDMESRRDKFFLDYIDKLEGDSYFTDYKIKNLRKGMDLTTRYGSINTDKIAKGFESVNINSGNTDISLEFEEESSYDLDIRHINSFLVLPSKNIKTEKKSLNEEKKEFMTYGTVGKSPSSSKLKIDANRGNIYIK